MAIPASAHLTSYEEASRDPMLRVSAKNASISATPRFADSGFSASGLAILRWLTTRGIQSAPSASFSLVARTGNIVGMRKPAQRQGNPASLRPWAHQQTVEAKLLPTIQFDCPPQLRWHFPMGR
jgi:hypothetical protein